MIDKERQNVRIMVQYTLEHNLDSYRFTSLNTNPDKTLKDSLLTNPFDSDQLSGGTVSRIYDEKDINDFESGKKNTLELAKIDRAKWSRMGKGYTNSALDKELDKFVKLLNGGKIASSGFVTEIRGNRIVLIAKKSSKTSIKEEFSMNKKNDLVKQKEEIALIEQEYMERDRLRQVRAMREQDAIQESIDAREEARQEAVQRQRSFGQFSEATKKSLLKETMIAVYEASLPNNLKNNDKVKGIGIGMIDSYVEQEGAENILHKNKYNSLFLSEMNRIINEYHSYIIEKADRNCPEFCFDASFKDKFFDEIKGEDFDEITDAIRMRVSDAIEEFINTNINNKYDIDEVISQTKEKIDKASYGTPEDVKQEYANIGKRRIESIKNRKYGLLEALVQRISKSAMVNEQLSEAFTNEEGRVDMDMVVESATAIYAFLEMLNTTKITTVDESYIRSFLEDMDAVNEGKIKDKLEEMRKKVFDKKKKEDKKKK